MNRIILLCAMLTVSFSVMAVPFWWMKKDDPNSLGLLVYADSACPFSTVDLKNMAEGEYLRARIKPTEPAAFIDEAVFLRINTTCVAMKAGDNHIGYAMSYNVFFATIIDTPNTAWMQYSDIGYDGLSVSGEGKEKAKTDLLNFVEESVSAALTDYLKANLE